MKHVVSPYKPAHFTRFKEKVMKKFLITFFPGWGEFRLDFYVEASSEEEAAKKLGVAYDPDDESWCYRASFVRFDEIKEVSERETFKEIVEQEEKKWEVLIPKD